MPDFEDQARVPRPSEVAANHGYPLGFAKSQWLLRHRLLIRMRRRFAERSVVEIAAATSAHEAMARALDWERLLGSFNHFGEDRFPLSALDIVACDILVWLDYQGFQVVQGGSARDEPLPNIESRLPTVFDNARRIVVLIDALEDPDVFPR